MPLLSVSTPLPPCPPARLPQAAALADCGLASGRQRPELRLAPAQGAGGLLEAAVRGRAQRWHAARACRVRRSLAHAALPAAAARAQAEHAGGFAAVASHGWLLAGGLTPETVAEAIATAAPSGVDVSSGVCGPDGLKKDLGKVEGYCGAAAAAFQRAAAAAAGA